jgi:hypothetical protein
VVCDRRVVMWEARDDVVREGRLPRTVTKLPRDANASCIEPELPFAAAPPLRSSYRLELTLLRAAQNMIDESRIGSMAPTHEYCRTEHTSENDKG